MIELKVKQLQRDLHEPIGQLSGKEGTQLLQLISKLQAYYPHLSSPVFVSVRANDGCEAAKEQLKPIQHYLDNCQTKLAALNAEADKFLIPIIESIRK